MFTCAWHSPGRDDGDRFRAAADPDLPVGRDGRTCKPQESDPNAVTTEFGVAFDMWDTVGLLGSSVRPERGQCGRKRQGRTE